MYASPDVRTRLVPSGSAAPGLAALFVDERHRETERVSIPRPEVHLVVRIGPAAPGGLDVHVFGARRRVHRKWIGSGQRAVTARLHLGMSEAVLGVAAPSLVGHMAPLDELWGTTATRRLLDRLSSARDALDAAAILDRAIGERLATTDRHVAHADFVRGAAARLTSANVRAVASDLGVSERHLRRVFRDAVGIGPKEFAKLTRFGRALRAAREAPHASWARIAAEAGYYDQAHLIAEFRAIAGVTPPRLLAELSSPM